MADVVDFRVNDHFAVGHDALNVIIFRARPSDSGRSRCVRWGGQAWRAVRFIGIDKAVLLRDLRELGASPSPLALERIASMPSDLREYRDRIMEAVDG